RRRRRNHHPPLRLTPRATGRRRYGRGVASGHDWKAAGEAWGHAQAEWATLAEHGTTDGVIAIFERTGVGPGVDLLDVACGSGLAMFRARNAGATVSGLG